MNGQIKKNLINAGLDIKHDGIVLTKNITGAEGLQKFAELIVQECIAKYDEWAEESFDQTSFRMASHNVKKHFGVE